MKAFVRETRYVVLKMKDLTKAGLSSDAAVAFHRLCDQVTASRIARGKGALECVVVESDWPEYEPTWGAIERRMQEPQPTPPSGISAWSNKGIVGDGVITHPKRVERGMASSDEFRKSLDSMPHRSDAGRSNEPVAWRCFHCDEVFTERTLAAAHFGYSESNETACKIKAGAESSMLNALRRAEDSATEAWRAVHEESTEAAKAFFAQAGRHREQLQATEELGYERGLAAADPTAITVPRAVLERAISLEYWDELRAMLKASF